METSNEILEEILSRVQKLEASKSWPLIMDTKTFCRAFCVSRRKLNEWLDHPQYPLRQHTYKVDGKIRIKSDEALRWLENFEESQNPDQQMIDVMRQRLKDEINNDLKN